MEIDCIFAPSLFAFRYEDEMDNEYDRLMYLWDDVEYIFEFLKNNREDIPKDRSIEQLADWIVEDAIKIDEKLIEITESTDKTLSYFFQPLHNQEYKIKVLSLQKGKKGRKSCLRIYAIKISENIFVITGGAIKLPLHHLMEDREHTLEELKKLEKTKNFLKSKGVFDDDSFFEFINED